MRTRTPMTKMIPRLVSCAIVLAVLPAANADNWPHWRGPKFNGVSDEKDLPTKWSAQENISWKVAMPAWSGATPIIWGDKIFLNVAESGDLYLWSVDRDKTAVTW